MDAQKLPARPRPERYRKLAKDLLAARRSEDPSARFTLSDARLQIARSYGFESWAKFQKHVEAAASKSSAVSQFESAAGAIVSGDLAALARLLRRNPELVRARSTRVHRATLLHYVAANGVEDYRQKTPPNAVAVARLLLEAGAEVDAENYCYRGGSTALCLVATSVHPERAGVQIALMETLLGAGAAIDGLPGGSHPLNAALGNGRGEAAEFLANRGARLDAEGAAGVGCVDVLRSLIDGATAAQMTAGFLWACEYGRIGAVEFLLERGLDVATAGPPHGQTGLHWAAHGGHVDTVKLLLDRHAPVGVKDASFAGTPMDWALHGRDEAPADRRDRYRELVELLVAAGAAPAKLQTAQT